MPSPHEVLGVAYDASIDDITVAYRRLAQSLHPDKPTGDLDKFNRLQAAYNVLRTKHKAMGAFDDIIEWAAKENKV